MSMLCKFSRVFDPLDRELLERALEAASAEVKKQFALDELEGDEQLEAALRRELVEIARSNGMADSDLLRDIALAPLPTIVIESVSD
jgi:hypothetical protein